MFIITLVAFGVSCITTGIVIGESRAWAKKKRIDNQSVFSSWLDELN